jgi:hypothetical protein
MNTVHYSHARLIGWCRISLRILGTIAQEINMSEKARKVRI